MLFYGKSLNHFRGTVEPWHEPGHLLFGEESCGYEEGEAHPMLTLMAGFTEQDAVALKDSIFSGHCGDGLFIKYFGSHCLRRPFFLLPENRKYRMEVIDTWNMTKITVVTGANGIT